MLTPEDIRLFQGMLERSFTTNNGVLRQEMDKLRNDLCLEMRQNSEDLKRDIRDEMHSLLKQTKREIVDELTTFLNDAILPQFDDVNREIKLIKNHLKLA